ncbi:hypothetical protein AB6F62_11240 [Providencia huaxiensis]
MRSWKRLNKPIILSKLAAQKKVTGNLIWLMQMKCFKALARQLR